MNAIMDTGPWVALIDRSEGRHKQCVHWLDAFRGNLFSTEAVLTEVLHLLDSSVQARSAAIDFVLEGAIVLVPCTLSSLKRAKELESLYARMGAGPGVWYGERASPVNRRARHSAAGLAALTPVPPLFSESRIRRASFTLG